MPACSSPTLFLDSDTLDDNLLDGPFVLVGTQAVDVLHYGQAIHNLAKDGVVAVQVRTASMGRIGLFLLFGERGTGSRSIALAQELISAVCRCISVLMSFPSDILFNSFLSFQHCLSMPVQ